MHHAAAPLLIGIRTNVEAAIEVGNEASAEDVPRAGQLKWTTCSIPRDK